MYLYILLFLILLILILILIYNYNIIENFDKENIITIVCKNYMKNIINKSIFFKRMNDIDLKIRNVKNTEEYKQIYYENIENFNDYELETLNNIIKNIDYNINNKDINIKGIKWKLCKINNKIENGFPHTLEDVIILSDSFFNNNIDIQKEILIHEIIHVYQRLYPINTHKFIKNKFKLDIIDTIKKFPNARNNPDINQFVYGKDNKCIIQLYNNDAKNILDSSTYIYSFTDNKIIKKIENNKYQLEHPYEMMASILSKKINVDDFDSLNIISF